MIPWLDIVQNGVSILALAVLYDIAYRLSQNFPQYMRYDVAVALAFGAVIMFMQLSTNYANLATELHPIHMGFELLPYIALIGGWLSGAAGLGMYIGADWLIHQHIPPFPYILFLVALVALGYALRVGYKPSITAYTITELLTIWLVSICLLVLLPLLFGESFPLLQPPAIFAEWMLALFITFMLLGLVLRRVVLLHETEIMQKQRAEYESFLTKSISDDIMHVRFNEAGEVIEVTGMFDHQDGAPHPAPRHSDNTLRWMDLCHPDDTPIAKKVLSDLRAGQSVVAELRMQAEGDTSFVW